MLSMKESSYFEEKVIQNSKNTKELGKPLTSLALNAKKGNKAEVSLNKDGTIQFVILGKTQTFSKVLFRTSYQPREKITKCN